MQEEDDAEKVPTFAAHISLPQISLTPHLNHTHTHAHTHQSHQSNRIEWNHTHTRMNTHTSHSNEVTNPTCPHAVPTSLDLIHHLNHTHT